MSTTIIPLVLVFLSTFSHKIHTKSIVTTTTNNYENLTIVPREGWCALPPTSIETMRNPVPFVVIHHSASPPACYTRNECVAAMRSMQIYHQQTQGWYDIGYSFAVGGDGAAYEGRGWSTVGAHAPSFNDKSIGICVIGDWREESPPQEQLDVVKNLIDYGVFLGKIHTDYKLVGHRQVRNGTVCPGDALFEEIKTWEHYEDYPDMSNATYKPKRGQTTKLFTVKQADKVMHDIKMNLPKCDGGEIVESNNLV